MTSYLGRQAVVIVHGIGEQKPLSSLLGFVGGGADHALGILDQDEVEACYVTPDTVTNRLDLRRISVNFAGRVPKPSVGPEVDIRPMPRQTQFFEYYWANRFRDTKKGHLIEWSRPLLFLRREDLSQAALLGPRGWSRWLGLAVVTMAWLGLAVSLVGLFQGSAEWVSATWIPDHRQWMYVIAAGYAAVAIGAASGLGLVTLIRTFASVAATVVAGTLLGGLGDPGRAQLSWQWTVASTAVAIIAFLGERHTNIRALRWLTRVSLLSLAVSLIPPALVAPAKQVGLGVLAAGTVTLVTGLVGNIFLKVVGDAARYFTNNPGNLEDREAIRIGLVQLLSELHDRRDIVTGQHEYDRVVVVAHSLGSVIAYDAIAALWARRSKLLGLSYSRDDSTNELERVIREAERQVSLHPPRDGQRQDEAGKEFDEKVYRQLQERLFYVASADSHDTTAGERQPEGSRWIVSHLVTLGSPLTYTEALLVDGGLPAVQDALSRKFLVRCPPIAQKSRSQRGTPLRFRWWKGPGEGHGTHFHHAAPFGPTQWTNMYYADDFVGGPLAGQLGQGIDDILLPSSATRRSLLRCIVRMPHTKYWRHANGVGYVPPGFEQSVTKLRDIITTHPLVAKVRMLPRQVEDVCRVLSTQTYLECSPSDPTHVEVRLQVYRPSTTNPEIRSWWLWAQPNRWCPIGYLPDLIKALTEEGSLSGKSIRIG